MKNKASDFYKTSSDSQGYKNKYRKGKGYYDSKVEDYYLDLIFDHWNIDCDTKVLEIGYFVGRINEKLTSFFKNITITDISQNLIDDYSGKSFLLNWSNGQGIDHQEKYDFICNIGHQLSFSCAIEEGVKFMSSAANKNAVLFFDIWNADCPKVNLPNYQIETMSLSMVKVMLDKYDLKLLTADYGFAFPYQYRKLFFLLNRFLGLYLGSKISWYLYRGLSSKLLSNFKGQNLFIVCEKII